ncbi:MAG: division/cell wall cluster transcriptional repressor MraZ [Coriobacteriia bacterium]|nr:division/cell wall cluster transcriptional repressor MraZ [Coriobacteriia bacterium]
MLGIMFFGEYTHTMDAKGRVSLPSKFRGRLTGSTMLVKGPEDCLWLFTPEKFEEFAESLLREEALDPDSRRMRRIFGAGTDEVEIDSAGRIRIPVPLRDHARLSKDLTIIGAIDRIEIWDSSRYADYTAESNIDELTAKLSAEGKL